MGHRRRSRSRVLVTLLLGLAAVVATTVPIGAAGAATSDKCGVGAKTVGFIFVGPKNDFGYNQAAYDGAMALKKQFPKLLLSCIGRITAERTLKIRDKDAVREMTLHGYTHFEKS